MLYLSVIKLKTDSEVEVKKGPVSPQEGDQVTYYLTSELIVIH